VAIACKSVLFPDKITKKKQSEGVRFLLLLFRRFCPLGKHLILSNERTLF